MQRQHLNTRKQYNYKWNTPIQQWSTDIFHRQRASQCFYWTNFIDLKD